MKKNLISSGFSMLSNPNRIVCYILLLLVSSVFGWAQSEPKTESYVIVDISVEGNRFTDAETIIAISGLRRGMQITLPGTDVIPTAVKNIWQRKQFSDVAIKVDKISSFGIFLAIEVKEFPRVGNITIRNNKEIGLENIRKAVGKTRGDLINPYDQYIIRKDVKKLYEDEGMIFSNIGTELEDSDTSGYANLIVTIDEGTEFYATEVTFDGNKDFDNGDLESEFDDTHTKQWWQFWRSAKFDQKKYQADKDLLAAFYKRNGYIDYELIKDTLIFNPAEKSVKVKVWLNEGKKYYVRNISFEGNTVYPSELLKRHLEFKKGDVYDVERFQQNLNHNEGETDVLSLYLDNGFLQAQIDVQEKRILPDSVDLTVKVIERDRVKIRKVEIVGNTKTKDKIIRRELYTKPGDYFSRSAIIRTIRALGVINYFNPETLQKPPDITPVASDNTQVDLTYKVEERSTDTFNASIGYAGTYGVTGSLGFTFNNFSLSEPLRGGSGQVFNFTWEFGQYSNNFQIGFTEPWLNDKPISVGVSIYDSRINLSYYNLRRSGIAGNIGSRFYWPDDYWRGDWSAKLQFNDVGENNTSYGSLWRSGKYSEFSVTQTLSRISYNNVFFPTSGSRFSLMTQFAMGSLGIGNTDFLKNELKYEVVSPLMTVDGLDKLTLFLATNFGYVESLKYDSTISPIDLYTMGGNGLSGYGSITPLRGYDNQTVGPYNGGKVMFHHTIELRYAISQDPMPVFVYAFAEAGNVWNNFKDMDPFSLARSAGIGVKLMMNPIGIIGFSYGYGFDIPTGGTSPSGWKFLFHLGQ